MSQILTLINSFGSRIFLRIFKSTYQETNYEFSIITKNQCLIMKARQSVVLQFEFNFQSR